VLLPAQDETLVIAGTLQSILSAWVLPSDAHVIDDGSADSTGGVARGLGTNVVRNEKNLGKAGAIGRSVEHFQLTRGTKNGYTFTYRIKCS
jgi:glycosyltransferase involved in cell wall biosynthesis